MQLYMKSLNSPFLQVQNYKRIFNSKGNAKNKSGTQGESMTITFKDLSLSFLSVNHSIAIQFYSTHNLSPRWLYYLQNQNHGQVHQGP